MDFTNFFKKAWYGQQDKDVYDANDFDELWGIEEPDKETSSRFLEHSIKKETGIGFKTNFKEISKVIEHPTLTSQSEVIVIEPRAFDEALDIVEQLRCRKSVVLNLQYLDNDASQRVVDFLAGATHALEGHQQRVGQGVFIFAPNNFVLTSESNEARALKDAFWSRTKKREPEQEYVYSEPQKKSSIF